MTIERPPEHRSVGAYAWFDAIRFVAAFCVVIGHTRNLLWVDAPQAQPSLLWWPFYFLTGFGHQAVMVFFVLSGYWITRSVDRNHAASDFWPTYLTSRGSRLLIVLIPALLVGGAIDWAGLAIVGGPHYAGVSGANALSYAVADRLTLPTLLGNLAFTQGQLVPPFGSNGPLWSLANEFWYYMWFPVLYGLVRRGRIGWMAVSLAAAWVMPGLLPGFLVWLMGSALYFFEKPMSARSNRRHRAARFALVPVLAVFIASLIVSRSQALPQPWLDLAVGAGFALFAAALLWAQPAMPKLLAPIARYGAGASYSLYATHFPLVVFMAAALDRGGRAMPGAGALLLFAGVVACALAWGWVFAQATEARTARVRDWLARAGQRSR